MNDASSQLLPLLSDWPEPPALAFSQVERRLAQEPGYLQVERSRLRTQAGAEFVYDQVQRRSLDAAVVVPYFFHEGGLYFVLRSANRPPVELREVHYPGVDPKLQAEAALGQRALWECPAGLIDAGEAPLAAAERELLEETGFAPKDALFVLGAAVYPCPGVIAERQYFYGAQVDYQRRQPASLDGSVLEELGVVVAVSSAGVENALAEGRILDAKTEIGLGRLLRYLCR